MTISFMPSCLLALAILSFSTTSSAMSFSIYENLIELPLKFNMNHVDIEIGEMPLKCGERMVNVVYKISADEVKKIPNKSALLLYGSPGTQFFGDVGGNYKALADALRNYGYQIIEISYPHRGMQSDENLARGFYAACFRQGLDSVQKHSADLYDAIVQKINYEPLNPEHQLIGFGFSLGAIELQSMAFSWGKKFDRIGLTGVMLGNAVQGCRVGLEYLAKEKDFVARDIAMCSEPQFAAGFGWHSFIEYAQYLTTSGNGCCLEGSSLYGGCAKGQKNEYTAKLNFESQPYYTASNLTIFEGTIACNNLPLYSFAGANPAQVKYIAEKRQAAGAPTKTYFYNNCAHDVLGCANNNIVKDILNALVPESLARN